MGSRKRRTALKAAAAYYGFSTNDRSLPDAVEASVSTVPESDPPEVPDDVRETIETAWSENVGAISRTARLSHTDLGHYVQKARGRSTRPDLDEVRPWMEGLVGGGICLVEIERSGETKLLLVNTAISS